jgi:hypothetical protein
MTKEIENEFKELVKSLEVDELDIDNLTQEDLGMLGYNNWDDFWESVI